MQWIFSLLAISVSVVVAFLLGGRDIAVLGTIMGIVSLSFAVSDLIAIPIWRSRVVPPYVRVKKVGQIYTNIIILCTAVLSIVFVIYYLVTYGWLSFEMTVNLGLITVAGIIWLILFLFEKIEICANGVWQNGKLHLWDTYQYFYWKTNTTDYYELRLVLKPGFNESDSTRLEVRPEHMEAVHQLLEYNKVDQKPLEKSHEAGSLFQHDSQTEPNKSESKPREYPISYYRTRICEGRKTEKPYY
jgi:hypothetical protein